MKVLIDIVHPAHVLFFKKPIEILYKRGDEVLILSRHKDVTCSLLDEFGFPHQPITRIGSGVLGLAAELIRRDLAILRAVRYFRPHIMIGCGGVAISHIGKLSGVPAIAFFDHEDAKLQTRLTWPFIHHLYVQNSYAGPTPKGRTTRLAGVKALSYMHPSVFQPIYDIALKAGLDDTCDNYFVRLVAWQANHDIGETGWSFDELRSVLNYLSKKGKVHLSSEMPVPEEFESYQYRGPKGHVHHLLAYCRLLIGESATMATEAAILGVPGIYAGHDFPGYTLEFESQGLVYNVRKICAKNLINSLKTVLDIPQSVILASRDNYITTCPVWSESVITALDQHAKD